MSAGGMSAGTLVAGGVSSFCSGSIIWKATILGALRLAAHRAHLSLAFLSVLESLASDVVFVNDCSILLFCLHGVGEEAADGGNIVCSSLSTPCTIVSGGAGQASGSGSRVGLALAVFMISASVDSVPISGPLLLSGGVTILLRALVLSAVPAL